MYTSQIDWVAASRAKWATPVCVSFSKSQSMPTRVEIPIHCTTFSAGLDQWDDDDGDSSSNMLLMMAIMNKSMFHSTERPCSLSVVPE
jgi:hypothetical protein